MSAKPIDAAAPPLSNIEIAQRGKLRPIMALARERLGIPEEALEPYGHYKAKVSLDYLASLTDRPDGQPGAGDGDLADSGGRGQDHDHGGSRRCAEPARQARHGVPARAGARAGVRHEGRRCRRGLLAGGADGRHQPALHRRLCRHRARQQPAGRAHRQPHLPGQPARLRRAPHHLAAGRGRERPRAAPDRRRSRRHGQRRAARGRLRHRGGLRGDGHPVPGLQPCRPQGAARAHRGGLSPRSAADPGAGPARRTAP